MEQDNITIEQVGINYLTKLCIHIYSKYGHDFYNYSESKHDIELILKIVNYNKLELTFNIDKDAIMILENSNDY